MLVSPWQMLSHATSVGGSGTPYRNVSDEEANNNRCARRGSTQLSYTPFPCGDCVGVANQTRACGNFLRKIHHLVCVDSRGMLTARDSERGVSRAPWRFDLEEKRVVLRFRRQILTTRGGVTGMITRCPHRMVDKPENLSRLSLLTSWGSSLPTKDQS